MWGDLFIFLLLVELCPYCLYLSAQISVFPICRLTRSAIHVMRGRAAVWRKFNLCQASRSLAVAGRETSGSGRRTAPAHGQIGLKPWKCDGLSKEPGGQYDRVALEHRYTEERGAQCWTPRLILTTGFHASNMLATWGTAAQNSHGQKYKNKGT